MRDSILDSNTAEYYEYRIGTTWSTSVTNETTVTGRRPGLAMIAEGSFEGKSTSCKYPTLVTQSWDLMEYSGSSPNRITRILVTTAARAFFALKLVRYLCGVGASACRLYTSYGWVKGIRKLAGRLLTYRFHCQKVCSELNDTLLEVETSGCPERSCVDRKAAQLSRHTMHRQQTLFAFF